MNKYIDNPFYEGQKVICISDVFPVVESTKKDKSDIGKIPNNRPMKNKVYIIDEILGEYLRFSEFDEPEVCNWWKHTHFTSVTESVKYEENKILNYNSE